MFIVFYSDIGIGRALYNILPFKATVDLLDVANPEQGITLGMFALGVGFAVGTVPAGNIVKRLTRRKICLSQMIEEHIISILHGEIQKNKILHSVIDIYILINFREFAMF